MEKGLSPLWKYLSDWFKVGLGKNKTSVIWENFPMG